MLPQVLIIGAGEIGQSIGKILGGKEVAVTYWDKNPQVLADLGIKQADLPELVPAANFIFICVPSWAVREAVVFINSYLTKEAIIVFLSKGMEERTGKMMNELYQDLLPKKQPLVLLGGMMLAEEIKEGQFGALVVAARDSRWGEAVAQLFAGTNILIEKTADLPGVAIAGILKNIYALALGVSYGLGWGENVRGYLVVRALEEMKKIIKLLGGENEAALSLAGLGDLVATGFSSYSKNHEVGRDLVEYGETVIKSEGVVSLPSLVARLGDKYHDFPILRALSYIITNHLPAEEAFLKLLTGGK